MIKLTRCIEEWKSEQCLDVKEEVVRTDAGYI